jgi:hypothetical protein
VLNCRRKSSRRRRRALAAPREAWRGIDGDERRRDAGAIATTSGVELPPEEKGVPAPGATMPRELDATRVGATRPHRRRVIAHLAALMGASVRVTLESRPISLGVPANVVAS